jgi:hypothetical protein
MTTHEMQVRSEGACLILLGAVFVLLCGFCRYWLKGPKAGSSDVFYDKLPGPPDGISRALDGKSYYVTIFCPVSC